MDVLGESDGVLQDVDTPEDLLGLEQSLPCFNQYDLHTNKDETS